MILDMPTSLFRFKRDSQAVHRQSCGAGRELLQRVCYRSHVQSVACGNARWPIPEHHLGFKFNTGSRAVTSRKRRELDPSAITIADILRQAGYSTGIVKGIPLKAGSVLIFTEAVTHETLQWEANPERSAVSRDRTGAGRFGLLQQPGMACIVRWQGGAAHDRNQLQGQDQHVRRTRVHLPRALTKA